MEPTCDCAGFAMTTLSDRDGRGYGYRPRCLSSDGINDRLASMGLYPIANVGGDPYGRFIYMRVRRGYQELVVTVDGCTGQVVR
jgi:hypothetical protein